MSKKVYASGVVQAIAMWVATAITFFYVLPAVFAESFEKKINDAGGCESASYDTVSIWKALRTAKFGDCVMKKDNWHNAWIMRNWIIVSLALMIIVLLVVTFQMVRYGAIGAETILGGLGVAIAVSAVLAVVVLAMLVYVVVLGMLIMIGIGTGIVLATKQ